WRMHLDASRAAVRIVCEQLQSDADGFLEDLLASDAKAQVMMQSLAQGHGVPPECLPTGFAKAVQILEEAVRGFTVAGIPQHGNFWAEKTRDQFIKEATPRPVRLNPDGSVVRDPENAPLVQRLEGTAPGNRMPRFRPPVPAVRIGFIHQWIADGCPDDSPPGKIGVEHERDPEPELLTTPDPPDPPTTPLHFESDIKGLFRANPDRTSMLFKFDLHRYEDVRDHATDILGRLQDGTMPCDDRWPPERIATFQQWIADGRQP
ncbi:MAG: hypothetical protein ACRDSG_01105, partial [Pseudonocardiaceae bacterium]